MAIPNDLRQANRRRVLLAALREGPCSRSQLARLTALSQPTAGKIVDELLAEHVLTVETGIATDETRMGRPGQLLRLDGERKRFLGIQLGVVHTRLALFAVDPAKTDSWASTFQTPESAVAWISAVGRAAKKIIERKQQAVVLSVPGVVDESAGRSLLSPNLRWIEEVDLIQKLRAEFAVPVHVVQEIRCLARGEQIVQKTPDDFLLVDFGTGVGSAAVVGGVVFRGPLALTGEIGHIPVAGNTRPCGCGGVGCLETIISREALSRDGAGTGNSASINRWADFVESVKRNGLNPATKETINAAGLIIAGTLNMLGISTVIVTGSLTELPGAIEHLSISIRSATMWARFGTITVRPAERHRLTGMASILIDRVLAPSNEAGNCR